MSGALLWEVTRMRRVLTPSLLSSESSVIAGAASGAVGASPVRKKRPVRKKLSSVTLDAPAGKNCEVHSPGFASALAHTAFPVSASSA